MTKPKKLSKNELLYNDLLDKYQQIVTLTPVESSIPHLVSGNYTQLVAIAIELARQNPKCFSGWLIKNKPDNYEHALAVIGYELTFGNIA